MFTPKDLTKVSLGEFREFFNSFDAILCDCDGVLVFAHQPIQGTQEVVNKLKTLGKTIKYVTNNCTKTRKDFTTSLKNGGFDLEEADVILPTVAIIEYLKSINFDKKLFVMSFGGLQRDLKEAGFQLADIGPAEVSEETKTILSALFNQDEDVGAVIIDIDFNINYIRLQKAIFYLSNPKVHYITAALDDMITIGKNINLIGPQHFQNMIEKISGRAPLAFGKPGQKLIDFVKKELKVEPSRTLFIGDTFSDMDFANKAGYQKLLVLSGVVNKEDIENCQDPNLLSKYYLENVKDLNNLLDQLQHSHNSSL